MSASWHYLKDGRPFGPFTADQMRLLASSGLLAATDMVRCDADGMWVSAGTVPELITPVRPPADAGGGAAGAPIPPSAAAPMPPSSAAPPSLPTHGRAVRSWFAAAVTWAAVLPVAVFCLSDHFAAHGGRLHRPALMAGAVVAAATWSGLGLWATATGALPTATGRLRRRPVLNRVGGVAVVAAGWFLAAALAREAGRAGDPAAVAGYERYDLGGGEQILYPPGQRAAAERLGRALREAGLFDGRGPAGVAIDRRGDGWVVKVATPEPARHDPAVLAVYRESLGVLVAARAFPGEPVEYQLCDSALMSHAAVPLPPAGVAEVQGDDAVYYLGPVREEAVRVAAFLKPRLGAPGGRAFVLTRREAGWRLAPLGLDADTLTQEAAAALAADATALSRAVFAGGPAELVVSDREFRPKRTFRSAPAQTDQDLAEARRRWQQQSGGRTWADLLYYPGATPQGNAP